ncbi:hypothetical protein [Paenibacillus sp. N3.4]|uniref:hypothetical protein n=1 Tax=Paenibacillus sp. N3.4 TaxID=2603222 RepID=UPI0011CB3F9B|nr:hypothetical protein [Paenibacillus sp. N3.4]TXK81032.1 hypothetical protein FU659_17275 [Paenibacillus sp. N3.4]
MKRYIFVFLIVLASATGCAENESPPANSPVVSVLPSTDTHSFKPHTDHVPPNPEVMGLEERKILSPLGQELVALLDDYMYVFNNRIPQKYEDKFGAVDPAGSVQHTEGETLKLKATGLIRADGPSVTIVAYAELRHQASDPNPFWSGTQLFRFQIVDEELKLGYWNESAP